MGKAKMLAAIFLGFAAFVIIFIWFTRPKNKNPMPAVINNFEQCAKSGYPVMESYPRQCTVPGGRTFVEENIQEIRTPR